MKIRKLVCIAAAIVLSASCCVTSALAADASGAQQHTVTVTRPASDKGTHTYKAYEVFKGTVDADGNLDVTGWGDGVNSDALAAALKTFALSDSTLPFAGITDAASAAKAMENVTAAADVKSLARIIAENISATAVTSAGDTLTLSDGYYLILDEVTQGSSAGTPGEGNTGAESAYILEVVGKDVTIEAKSSAPTLVKKVQEKSWGKVNESYQYEGDKGFNDVADCSISDKVSFRLYGTVADNYQDFLGDYYYCFEDTLQQSLTFDASSVVVYVNGMEISADQYTVAETADGFTLQFADLKKVTAAKDGTALGKIEKIIVSYDATLNDNAVIGHEGNVNKAKLVYSNNPNFTGTGDSAEDGTKGETPYDQVIVFTYQLDVEKVDADDTAAKLANVEFILYDGDKNMYAVIGADSKVDSWVSAKESATRIKTGADGKLSVIGIEDGSYTIMEVKNPNSGYNTLVDTVIDITAATKHVQDWDGTASSALTTISVKVGETPEDGDVTAGTVAVQIKNSKSAALPTTGGVGTKVFYAVGGVLVLGAGIALIVIKRMKDHEAE